MIAAATDQDAGIAWSNVRSYLATSGALGAGQANTTAIVGQAGCDSGAAHLCDQLVEGGYSDWYLPSLGDLQTLFTNRVAIGGCEPVLYWSSFVASSSNAVYKSFADSGTEGEDSEGTLNRVRAVRSF